jgi:hypothetical protein
MRNNRKTERQKGRRSEREEREKEAGGWGHAEMNCLLASTGLSGTL